MFQSDFWKKISFSRFWPKMANFCHFLPIFSQKSVFLDNFFESAYQIYLKLGQKLGSIALNYRVAVMCLGKFLFWPFWSFSGQKKIASGDIYMVLGCFLSFSSEPLTFLVNLCDLNFVYGLGMINEKVLFVLFGCRRETSALCACFTKNHPRSMVGE